MERGWAGWFQAEKGGSYVIDHFIQASVGADIFGSKGCKRLENVKIGIFCAAHFSEKVRDQKPSNALGHGMEGVELGGPRRRRAWRGALKR